MLDHAYITRTPHHSTGANSSPARPIQQASNAQPRQKPAGRSMVSWCATVAAAATASRVVAHPLRPAAKSCCAGLVPSTATSAAHRPETGAQECALAATAERIAAAAVGGAAATAAAGAEAGALHVAAAAADAASAAAARTAAAAAPCAEAAEAVEPAAADTSAAAAQSETTSVAMAVPGDAPGSASVGVAPVVARIQVVAVQSSAPRECGGRSHLELPHKRPTRPIAVSPPAAGPGSAGSAAAKTAAHGPAPAPPGTPDQASTPRAFAGCRSKCPARPHTQSIQR
mmetsp:Transcript_27983/g.80195  ORF Transcript_27983/g.80195 Transcript_27983/m.80195 type:complete len:286 (+) Transcript_27983:40-897(+)